MELTALGLLVLGVALAEPVSRMLSRARWPARDPVGGLLVWQAIGLAGGLSLLGAGLVYGVAPLGPSLPAALPVLVDALAHGRLPAGLGFLHIVALLVALALALRLVGVLVAVTFRTLGGGEG
jgi:hypothetical protein